MAVDVVLYFVRYVVVNRQRRFVGCEQCNNAVVSLDILVQVFDDFDGSAVLNVDVGVVAQQQVGVVRHNPAVVVDSRLTAHVLREWLSAIFR